MPRTGRPRGFDKDQALASAMHLFWEHGYEASTLTKLRNAMGGMSTASFYAAFVSKEALFHETLALYGEKYGTCIASLFDDSLPPNEAIEQALRCSVDMQTGENHPLGCLVCSSTASCSPEAADVAEKVANIRRANHAAIRACVDRAARDGSIPPGHDCEALAATFNGFLVGISAQARDRVSRSTLQRAVSEIMRVWPSGVRGQSVGSTLTNG